MFRLACIVIGYFIGCIQTAYLISKMTKTDLRKQGSGNLGTTNALRVLGVKAGAVTFFGDILKSVLSFVVCWFLFREQGGMMAGVYGSIGAVLGHDFPFYLRFRGGKGIAATIGLILALGFSFSAPLMLLTYAVGIIGVAASGYISVGSMLFSVSIPLCAWFLHFPAEFVLVTVCLCVLALWKHRANIGRLRAGNENKFSLKKKK